MQDVTALGELLIDFISVGSDDSGYPTLKAQPGGAPANFLAALHAYGGSCAMIGKVGDDVFGHLLNQTLEEKGVDNRGVIIDPKVFTTLAFVTLDDEGNREFSFSRKPGADTCLHSDDIDYQLIEDSQVFHFGSLSLTNEPVRTATHRALATAKRAGVLISFDPNLRKPLWENLSIAKAQIEWGLYQADIVKISLDEVDFLWGVDAETAAKYLMETYGVKLVYVTLGPDGCYFANGQCTGYVESPKDINVVNTTGAGDIFSGAAMSRFLKFGKAPEELNREALKEITRFGCYAASLSTQKHGGIDSVVPEPDVIAFMERDLAK